MKHDALYVLESADGYGATKVGVSNYTEPPVRLGDDRLALYIHTSDTDDIFALLRRMFDKMTAEEGECYLAVSTDVKDAAWTVLLSCKPDACGWHKHEYEVVVNRNDVT